MSDAFIAEIRIFSFDFPPAGWAQCNGQILSIAQNTALFSLLGTTYGGNGQTTFALPNLQASLPLHQGQGPGLSQYFLGVNGGVPDVTLTEKQIPIHNHALMAASDPSNAQIPDPTESLSRSAGGNAYDPSTAKLALMAKETAGQTGGGKPHTNLMPYTVLNFCIALEGNFPPRD